MSKTTPPDRADRFVSPNGAIRIELPEGRGPLPQGPRTARRRAQTASLAVLAELRRSSGLTQAQLAERLGMTQSKVSQLERQDDARLSSIVDYLAALGTDNIEIHARVPAKGGEAAREVVVPLGKLPTRN
jgi:predicted XRE-type DNA-binding protein